VKYQNEQIYNECLLVSVWNAARHFKIEVPAINSLQYKELCEKFDCIKDGCGSIDKEIKRLGMYTEEGVWDINWIKKNIPVEIGIFCGIKKSYHSVLIVNVFKNKLLLANYAKKRTFWISWQKIKKMAKNKHSEYVDDPTSFKVGV